MKIYTELEKTHLLGILENSVDWYILLSVTPDEQVKIDYLNKVAATACYNGDLDRDPSLLNFPGFENLLGVILQVYKTKQRVNFPQFLFKNKETITILDLQIYTNNGNVVICGRDLAPIIYDFRSNLALLNNKLEKLLEETASGY